MAPVQVIEAKGSHLPAAETAQREQDQQRIVARSDERLAVWTRQRPLDLAPLHEPWKPFHRVDARHRDLWAQVDVEQAAHVGVAEKHPHGTARFLDRTPDMAAGRFNEEPIDLRDRQVTQCLVCLDPGLLEEPTDPAAVFVDRQRA